MRCEQVEKTRQEHKAQEAVKELLKKLCDQGNINARIKWKDIYPTCALDGQH